MYSDKHYTNNQTGYSRKKADFVCDIQKISDEMYKLTVYIALIKYYTYKSRTEIVL